MEYVLLALALSLHLSQSFLEFIKAVIEIELGVLCLLESRLCPIHILGVAIEALPQVIVLL